MTKSSSSSKKLTHSRDSSKLLRSVKKKKTKRNKSKKIKDYSDESEFSGSDSSLYSSSEDDYRRKKRQSKVSKKRSRKRYSSSESDDSDDDRQLKKKKRSKRKNERVGKKKKNKKISSRKRRRRDSSSSSTSSESGSFQDNQSHSDSDGKRRTRDRGRLGKVKVVRRRSEDELEEGNEPDGYWQVEDEVMTQKNSRRLKSIVVVSYTYDNDHRKENILDDHDDESDEDKFVDDERSREARHSYPKTGADEYGRKTVDYDESKEDIKSETSKSCRPENSLKTDDLEGILKKRALENLKRFRGEIQRSGIASKEVFSVSEGESLHLESENVEESQDRVSAGIKDLDTSQKVLQDANVKKPVTVLAEFDSQEDQQSGETAKVKASSGISSCTTKRKLIRPELGQDAEAESINGTTIDQNCPESSLDLATKNGSETIEPTKALSTLRAESSSHADTETSDEIKGGSQSEQKTMDETKDESQYEQKTMTVMRGGEMVQVSYKVYIPKKTSSLGRRQLKR